MLDFNQSRIGNRFGQNGVYCKIANLGGKVTFLNYVFLDKPMWHMPCGSVTLICPYKTWHTSVYWIGRTTCLDGYKGVVTSWFPTPFNCVYKYIYIYVYTYKYTHTYYVSIYIYQPQILLNQLTNQNSYRLSMGPLFEEPPTGRSGQLPLEQEPSWVIHPP